MAQPKLDIIIGEGGLGRPLAGKDHFSGMILYKDDATLPAGFGTDRIKQVFSLVEAEALGIVEGSADFDVLHYQVSEFFRLQVGGVLWINIIDGSVGEIPDFDAHDFAEITTLQMTAEGQIRQIGIIQLQNAFDAAQVTAINIEALAQRTAKMPLSVILGPDISGTADLSTLADLRALTGSLVSVVIGQDGDARGAALATSEATSMPTLGATLGTVSLANVNESIAWVEKFQLSDGTELEVAAFGNDDLWKLKSESFLDTLHGKGYIFIRKFTGDAVSGTYHQDSNTSVVITSDFAFIESNRTIDKAARQINTFVLPQLNRPLVVNPDGTVSEDTIAVFDSLTRRALETMERDAEISAFDVIINPEQNVLSTSKLAVKVEIVPVGVGRTLEFTIGFVLNIS